VIVRIPVRFPDAVGVNVTLTVQEEAAANVAWQLLTWLKSPVIWKLAILKLRFPVFVKTTD
jgi:hypothetical protein